MPALWGSAAAVGAKPGLPGLGAAAVRAADRRGDGGVEDEAALAGVAGPVHGAARLAGAAGVEVLGGGRSGGRGGRARLLVPAAGRAAGEGACLGSDSHETA